MSFQANRLLAGDGVTLRQGDYQIVGRAAESPWGRWYLARNLAAGDATPLVLVYPCSSSPQADRSIQLDWLRLHAAVRVAGLQPLEVIELAAANPALGTAWQGLVVSDLPPGVTLAKWLQATDAGWPLGFDEAVDLTLAIGGAVAAMHQAALVHGAICPERIWIADDGAVYLLRCGGGPPIPAGSAAAHEWFDGDQPGIALAASPATQPPAGRSPGEAAVDQATDLRALAALAHGLATGQPLGTDSIQKQPASARGAAVLRLLAETLAESGGASPATVTGFLTALQAASELDRGTESLPLSEPESGDKVATPAAPKRNEPRSAAGEQRTEARSKGEEQRSEFRSTGDRPVRRTSKRSRRQNHKPILIGSIGLAGLLVVGALVYRLTSDPTGTPPPPQPRLPTLPSLANSTTPPVADTSGFELVSDSQTLWGPPWAANVASPSLEMLPPGVQVIVSLRLETLLNSGAADWRGWFGDELGDSLAVLADRTGVAADQIDRLLIGLSPGNDGQPTTALVVWLAQPVELATLRDRWGVQAASLPGNDSQRGGTIYAGDSAGSLAYFIAGDDHDDATLVSGFAVGPLDQIRLVAEDQGAPPPLSRPLQTTWAQASQDAQIVVMAVPNFLFADGRRLLQQYAPRSVERLQQLLVPDVSVALLMIDTRENWYSELRLLPGGGVTAVQLTGTLKQTLDALPASAETFLLETDVDASWRAIALRLPQFLRAMQQQTRLGVSHSMATANAYLPAAAAPQVTLASLLALSTTGSGTPAPATPAATTPRTIDQMLDQPLTVQFAQESLEAALALVQEELTLRMPPGTSPAELQLMGGDLEKAGITQNQQVRDFNQRNVPLRTILTQLVQGANPDKTATSTTDPKQVLIWAVVPQEASSGGSAPIIRITTRAAAAEQSYQVPVEFTGG